MYPVPPWCDATITTTTTTTTTATGTRLKKFIHCRNFLLPNLFFAPWHSERFQFFFKYLGRIHFSSKYIFSWQSFCGCFMDNTRTIIVGYIFFVSLTTPPSLKLPVPFMLGYRLYKIKNYGFLVASACTNCRMKSHESPSNGSWREISRDTYRQTDTLRNIYKACAFLARCAQ